MLAVVPGPCRYWNDLAPGMLFLQLLNARQNHLRACKQIDFVEHEPKIVAPLGEVLKDILVFPAPVPGIGNLADDVSAATGTAGRLICHFTE